MTEQVMYIRHKYASLLARLFVLGLCLGAAACGGRQESGPAAAAVVTTPSGLAYQDLSAGEGEPAAVGQMVAVHYTAWIEEQGKRGQRIGGTNAGGEPFVFRLGRGEVIKGWDEGVNGMRPGGVRRLMVPPALVGYQTVAGSPVPPDATLIFEIELVEVRK